jgi:uncharacterized membrane protein YhhN
MKVKQILLPAFLIILVVHCICIYAELDLWRNVTKLLLVPLLITHLLLHQSVFNWKIRPVYGLFFSFLGDALLIGEGSTFFLSGMIAFVLAHLNYSYYFLQLQPVKKETKQVFVMSLILMLLFSSVVYVFLDGYLGSYQLPVLFYMLFISLMASLAIHTITHARLKPLSIKCFIPGAVLFVVSDAILALNMFRFHESNLATVVMLTYGLAQFFLTKGFEKNDNFES